VILELLFCWVLHNEKLDIIRFRIDLLLWHCLSKQWSIAK
jgi:hypothetical protein